MVPVGVREVRVGEIICHILSLLLKHLLQLVLLLHLIQALKQTFPLGILKALLLLLLLCKVLMILLNDLILFLQPSDPLLCPLHLTTSCLLQVTPKQLPLPRQLIPRGEQNPLSRELVQLAKEEGLKRCRLFARAISCCHGIRLKVGVRRYAILNSLLSLLHRGRGGGSNAVGALGELAVGVFLPVASLPLLSLSSGSSIEYPVPALPSDSFARPDR